MAIDFKREFGVNAGYVESLFEKWRVEPGQVDAEWQRWFTRLAAGESGSAPAPAADSSSETQSASVAVAASNPAAASAPEVPPLAAVEASDTPTSAPTSAVVASAADDVVAERLKGVAARIADNMNASLEVPTATSVRTIAVKVLHENRTILNGHMKVRALGKASYTHLIAYALVRALRDAPNMQSYFEDRDGISYKVTPRHVNLGIAIDLDGPKGRSLVVPCIKRAEAMGFKEFHTAYEDLVRRARANKLEAADFRDTTVSLSNPGGIGTHMSVPRLMKGQGLIIATGAIGVPTANVHMAPATLAELAIGPVMTITSTYDHRVIQGAESGLLLARIDDLLQGADHFYEEIFSVMRVPWQPAKPAEDVRPPREHEEKHAEKQAKVWQLIDAYRTRGCRIADLDPLEYKPDRHPSLDPAWYGFTIWDLDREFLAAGLDGKETMPLRDILATLADTYCRRWTIEYMHIANRVRRQWIQDRVELRRNEQEFDSEARLRILRQLYKAENFEKFLHTRYVGNKRFSLEGADALIPALSELIERAADNGIERVVIGMAHRGRLNVLANILNKSFEQIFREFEGAMLPLSSDGSGDVKYHLGQQGVFTTTTGKQVFVVLCANPSHLEAVDPVVLGMTRAYQDEIGDTSREKVLAILVHGDAAFAGQGVVAETLNMSNLPANRIGGTVHIVVNNQIGFTAGPRDTRSTYYCTDLAKGIDAPVLHANGDYPEAVLRAVHVALDYQQTFRRDAFIDLVCYRRWGHNEGDEPAYTQPALYKKIRQHPTPTENYAALLTRRGQLTKPDADSIGNEANEELRIALEHHRAHANEPEPALPFGEVVDLTDDDPRDYAALESPVTAVTADELVSIIDRSNAIPAGHVVHPNLLRQLRKREEMVRGELAVDWGCGEALAFGSLLRDGVPIRLQGQDSRRGTFSQRHAVIRDQVTEKDWIPLAHIDASATFEVWDSLLSEEAALAFEYGYAVIRKQALVLWEAQFGDFVNGAQIAIDQFLISSETKWKQLSGVTLLLPHGYDGQGPEHSSGRIERFLTLCADGNITVANCTSSAQYFHLLRRQGLEGTKRPLIVFTPKSLLRDPRAASPIERFTTGSFLPFIAGDVADAAAVKRVILCSGKVFYDLEEYRQKEKREDVAIARIEQLYPFPQAAVNAELARFPGASVVWAQEEPKNMGAWTFVRNQAEIAGFAPVYAGRAASSSPATGSYMRHNAEQEWLVKRAFS